jgi:pimeloyl-ACP methyl ester carboxylesterase
MSAAPYGVDLEIAERGEGSVVIVLHDESGANADSPFISQLAEHHRVIVPSHPGFGRSSVPDEFDSVDDLAYFYLELFDELSVDTYTLVGCAFGGWIAAEIAVQRPPRLDRLVLIDSVGIRVGGIEDRDVADVFALSHEDLSQRLFFDPAAASSGLDFSARSDEELEIIARNRESTARYGWVPFMHNPRLRRRLHRISAPTLVLWGAQDGIVGANYGRAFADSIPGSLFTLVENAGHLPHLERPEIVVQ